MDGELLPGVLQNFACEVRDQSCYQMATAISLTAPAMDRQVQQAAVPLRLDVEAQRIVASSSHRQGQPD